MLESEMYWSSAQFNLAGGRVWNSMATYAKHNPPAALAKIKYLKIRAKEEQID